MSSDTDILVIDDEQVILSSAEKILADSGYSVEGALTPEEGLQKLKRTSFKLLLVDLMLPQMSGLELIDIASRDFPAMPVIMITGYATLESAVQSLKRGAFDFVPKPFSYEELVSVTTRAENYGAAAPQNSKLENPEDYSFLGRHSWAKLDSDGAALVGVAETFSQMMGAITQLTFPGVNEVVSQGNVCAKLLAAETYVHTVWAPLSGRIIEINPEVREQTTLLDTDPFDKGWLLRVEPSNLTAELEDLVVR